MMKKIDGHLHLVRSLAGLNGKGRLTPLGGGVPFGMMGKWSSWSRTAGAMIISWLTLLWRWWTTTGLRKQSCYRGASMVTKITTPGRSLRSIRNGLWPLFLSIPLPSRRWQLLNATWSSSACGLWSLKSHKVGDFMVITDHSGLTRMNVAAGFFTFIWLPWFCGHGRLRQFWAN